MNNLKDRVAFITGGVSGIGLGIARALCASGMKVIVTYRRERHLAEGLGLLRDIPGAQVHALQLDVTDREAFKCVVEEAERVFGPIHLLCNNAGAVVFGPADVATYEDWDWIMGVNFGGTVNGLMTVVPRMKAHREGGHIVNVASMAALTPSPNAALYTAAKYAVRGLTECLRYNLAPHQIGVSLMCPGLTRTNIYESLQSRPAELGSSGYRADDAFVKDLRGLFAIGMDPLEVGQKTVRGIMRNDLYILTHPEFKEEIQSLGAEVLASFPDEVPDSKRLAFEDTRRANQAGLRARYHL